MSWARVPRSAALGVACGALLSLMIGLPQPSSASAATTCPGRNGKLAVTVGTPVNDSEVIGVTTPAGDVRLLFSPKEEGQESLLGGPSFSCDGREIAYSVDNDSRCEALRIVDVRTGRTRELRVPSVCGSDPAFLSNGRIVFDGRDGTYIIDADGSHLHRLFGDGMQTETANGRWFISNEFRNLVLLDAKGRRVRQLAPALPAGAGEYLHAHFSPDGRWIVYEKQPHVVTENRDGDLFMVRRDGTHRRRLTSGHDSSEPVFSPDGRWIAFIRSAGAASRNVYELSVKHPGVVRALTRIPDANFYDPTWGAGSSPAG